MWFLIVLMFTFMEYIGGTTSYEHLDPVTGQSITCNRCPAGYHMSAHCTATSQTECHSCPTNHYTEYWNYLPKCLYCSTFCVHNQFIKEDCSSTHDRVCECNEGYYWFADMCIKHSECPAGYGVKRRGTTNSDTECKRCQKGFFSSVSSSHLECENHTNCASRELKTIFRGTSRHDNTCASCENFTDGGDMTHIRTILLHFFSHQRIHQPKMKELLWRFLLPHTNQQVQIQLDKHFPRQKETILSLIRQWIRQAPEEDLKRLPEWLRKSNLNHIAQRLERRIRIMDQRCQ
ncbi:tumor necrosis factor receptor superfamily member 11B-like [Osmerus eperlanus]|uniref:tumor necrosis factor receptor superfamily member 11B-like n=1 Tax=Osmerus eperlanus TaxID=29151 RepID=UPI002E10EF4A